MKKRQLLALTSLALANGPIAARAQAYPSRPVRLMVGFTAGGTIDVVARIVGEHLAKSLGQPFVVENRPGANAAIAAELVARARPDGQTLFVSNSSSITLVNALVANPPYDPVRSFRALGSVLTVPLIICVNASDARMAEVRTLADLLTMARSNPGALAYGSAGPGNITHLGFELLSKVAGVQMLHVPYNGAVAAQVALLSGNVSVIMDTMSAVPQIQAGRMRPLAVTTLSRLPALPDVPTVAESGHAGFDVSFWVGFFAPAGLPDPIALQLEQQLAAAVNDPAVREQLRSQGVPDVILGDAFRQKIQREIETLTVVARQAGIEPR